jgi:hypothetical protein
MSENHLEYSSSNNYNSEIINKLLDEMFDGNEKYFLNSTGVTGCKVNLYNEMIHCVAVIFFKILDHFNLDYYVFAGSAIGLCRDGNNIPWVDDYDIIIFEDQIELFEKTIFPFFKERYYFNCILLDNKSGCQIVNQLNNKSIFQCDVFYSYISKEGYVKNNNIDEPWGLYDTKNISIEIVKPKKYCLFNGINLPFFNEYKKDIEIEYGDIYNNCVIHINHGHTIINIPYNFMEVYDEFSNITKNAIENTRMLIESNKYVIQDLNEIKCDVIFIDKFIINKENNYFVNSLQLLTFLNNHKLENITLPIHLLKYVCDIKFYFPKIKINVIINDKYENILHYLNFVDNIQLTNCLLTNYYFNESIFWYKIPTYEIINTNINLNYIFCNTKDYIDLNEDLKDINEIEAKNHYEHDGYKENRKYKYENIPNDFNAKDYIELNEDLKDINEIEAKNHYEHDGYKENRKYKYENIPNDFSAKKSL